jgi:hypothetical protein
MSLRCQSCNSCGMPFEKAEDHALGNTENEYCAYCVHPDGTLKSYDEILLGTAEFLIQSQGIDKKAAEAIARETLQNLPAWKP